jgi:hypothetical protein
VDIRVKSFVPEAADRLDFLCVEYGFTGPEVVPDEAGVYPLVRRVRYRCPGCSIEISTAHTGYQMRRALDRQAETVRNQLQDESSPHS